MSCFTRFQYTDTYALAARVKTKLTDEAVRANVNLRRLVCQANLLDTLINTLNTPSNNVSFESINNNLFYTSDDSDFDDSDNSDDDESESDLESDLSVDDTDFVTKTTNDEHFNYLSDALQRLNMSSQGYVENVEEILSSESDSETEQQFDVVNFEDDDEDEYEGLSLSKMASNASHMYQHYNNDDQYFHDDNDTLHENSSSEEDLPSLSNCSSLSSLEESPVLKASEYQLNDIKNTNTNTNTHSSYPLLNYS